MQNMSPLLTNLLDVYQRQKSLEEEQEEEEDDDYAEQLPDNAKKFASLVNILTKKNRFVRNSRHETIIRTLGGSAIPERFRKSRSKRSQSISSDNKENSGGNETGTRKTGSKWRSVLMPENRDFLKNEGQKSPEATPKRLIIGSSSFSICKNGEIIKEQPTEQEDNTFKVAESPTSTTVERLTSVESSSDGSSNPYGKRSQRHASVWSMASSMTSIDSHEEDLEEQRKLLNLQMSRNRNNRIDEDLDDYEYREPTVKEKWKAAIDGTLDALLSQRRRVSRTSTPNRYRTLSSGSIVAARDFSYTIEEEMGVSDIESKPDDYSDVFAESRNLKR